MAASTAVVPHKAVGTIAGERVWAGHIGHDVEPFRPAETNTGVNARSGRRLTPLCDFSHERAEPVSVRHL